MTNDTPKEDESDEDDNTTTSTRERWTYIATVLSALILITFAALLLGAAAGLFSLSAIGQGWFILYSTVVLMAATWAFGKETLEAVYEARSDSKK